MLFDLNRAHRHFDEDIRFGWKRSVQEGLEENKETCAKAYDFAKKAQVLTSIALRYSTAWVRETSNPQAKKFVTLLSEADKELQDAIKKLVAVANTRIE